MIHAKSEARKCEQLVRKYEGILNRMAGMLGCNVQDVETTTKKLVLATRPISVNEKLPEPGETVLAWSESGSTFIRLWCAAWRTTEGRWLTDPGEVELRQVTHWMPLPTAP